MQVNSRSEGEIRSQEAKVFILLLGGVNIDRGKRSHPRFLQNHHTACLCTNANSSRLLFLNLNRLLI